MNMKKTIIYLYLIISLFSFHCYSNADENVKEINGTLDYILSESSFVYRSSQKIYVLRLNEYPNNPFIISREILERNRGLQEGQRVFLKIKGNKVLSLETIDPLKR